MTLAWPPDQSTQLTIAFIVIALMALALILMYVHFHGGIKALHLLYRTPSPPVVNVQPTIHVDPAQLDAAIAKALDARSAATANPLPWDKP